MQSDMHYYGLAFIARAAGFSLAESETIAYASQYVDDSTEGEPIHVGDYLFDPVRTAHYSLEAYTWGVQSKIYIPFHFLPPQPHKCQLVTKPYPGSPLSKLIFHRACEESLKDLRLVRIGVALHTIADTFSHQGFSGRKSNENKLSTYSVKSPETMAESSTFDRIKSSLSRIWSGVKKFAMPLIPTIGHAQAINNPDLPYLNWSFTYDSTNQKVDRNNTADFLEGSNHLYTLLTEAVQPKKRKNSSKDPEVIPPLKTWDEIKNVIEDCLVFTGDEEERCSYWHKQFCQFFGEELTRYDKYLWRMEALQPENKEHIMWDKISRKKRST